MEAALNALEVDFEGRLAAALPGSAGVEAGRAPWVGDWRPGPSSQQASQPRHESGTGQSDRVPAAPGPGVLLARATDRTGRAQRATTAHNTQGYLFDAVVRHPVAVV